MVALIVFQLAGVLSLISPNQRDPSCGGTEEPCWLVIASPDDLPALWVYQGLTRLSNRQILLIAPEMLCTALSWQHRLGKEGTFSQVGLSQDLVLQSSNLCGVFNRFTRITPLHWQRAAVKERAYAEQEYFALMLSWLNSLSCPVINPPSPKGLSGDNRSIVEWRMVALQAGLPIMPLNCDGHGGTDSHPIPVQRIASVYVVQDRCYGHLPDRMLEPVQRFCRQIGQPMLELRFGVSWSEQWLFLEGNPWPDLRQIGAEVLPQMASLIGLPTFSQASRL